MPNTNDQLDPEHASRLAWITRARRMHRNKRMVGFAGVMVGAGLVGWWKLTPWAPDWSLWTGGGLLAASWALFIYVIVSRWRWVKTNPPSPSERTGG